MHHIATLRGDDDIHIGPQNTAVIGHTQLDKAERKGIEGISRQREVQVYVGDADSDCRTDSLENGKELGRSRANSSESQIPLKDLGRSKEVR